MTILLSDERVRAVPVVESGEPLVRLPGEPVPRRRAGARRPRRPADGRRPAAAAGHPAPGGRGLPAASSSSARSSRRTPRRCARTTRASTTRAGPADQPVRRARRRRAARRRRRGRPDPGRRVRRGARPGHADRRDARGERRSLLLRRRRHRRRRPGAPRRCWPTVLSAPGAGELPDRVVALELRRPLLGAGHRRPARALRAARRGGGGMTAPGGRDPAAPRAAGPRLDIDLDAVGRNTRLLARPGRRRADGRGEGRRVRPRRGRRRADGARARRHPARRHHPRRGVAAARRRPRRTAAELAQPGRRRLRDARPARDVDVAVPEPRAPRRGRRGARPRAGSTCTSTPGWRATAPTPPSWARLCRAARRAEQRGEVEVVGVMGHLGCADDPSDACNALGRTRFAWALETARAVRPAARATGTSPPPPRPSPTRAATTR